jgi:hypothetical protein
VQTNAVAWDLHSGHERWHVTDFGGGDLWGGIYPATLGENGDVIAWSRHNNEHVHRNWLRWQKDDGLWFPETWVTQHEQPTRVVLSAKTGALVSRDVLARPDERIQAFVSQSGARGALFFRSTIKKAQLEAWRVVRVTDGGRAISRELGRPPGGPAARLDFPEHAVVTPSGHIAIAGDPAGEKAEWRITVW